MREEPEGTAEPYRIPERELAAIGRIALAGAGIESVTEGILWSLLGLSEAAGGVVTDRMGFSQVADRLTKLARIRGVLTEEILAFLKAARIAQGHRNAIVHALWVSLDGVMPLQAYWRSIASPKGPQRETGLRMWPPGRLAKVAATMEELVRRAVDLHAHLDQVLAIEGRESASSDLLPDGASEPG